MAVRRIIGVILIALGIIALVWGGISWTQEKNVVDAGPIQVQTEERKSLPMPPVLGAVALVVGALLLVVPARTRD